MGKYIRKGKIAGEVAAMEPSLGVRTRAKTLALKKKPPKPRPKPPTCSSSSSSKSPSCYLQLRSRRLEKCFPTRAADKRKDAAKPECDGGIEVSLGENVVDVEGMGSRNSRETTPCNLIRRDSDPIGTPGSTNRPTSTTAVNRITPSSTRRNIPTSREMEEFFAVTEQQHQRAFADNFVVLRQPRLLPCAHVVCSQCIVVKNGEECECPVCLATCLCGDIRHVMLIEKMVDIFKSLDNAIASGVQKLCPRLLADHNSVDGHGQGSEVDKSSQNNTEEKFDDGIFDMHGMMRTLPAKPNPLSGNNHTKEKEEEEHVSNVFGGHQNNLQSQPRFVTKRMLGDGGGSAEPSTFGRKTCTHNAGKDADIDPVQPSTPSSLHNFTERKTYDGERSGISASSTPASGSSASASLFSSTAGGSFGNLPSGSIASGANPSASGSGFSSSAGTGSSSPNGSSSSTPAAATSPFGSSSQNPTFSQNHSPFQRAGDVDFNLGGSFSLGSVGGGISSRKLVKAKRDKTRRK